MRFLYTLLILIPCIFGSANSAREELIDRSHPMIACAAASPTLIHRDLTMSMSLNIEPQATETKKWLLSLDGGGIRGIMQLKMLAGIESRTGKSIIDLFDGISGTSIGGVIACVLTMPDPKNSKRPKYSPQNLLDFFAANKDRFFVSKWQSMGGLLRTRYKTTSLKNMLLELLGDNRFSERLLPIVLTANDLQLERARFFQSTGPENFYARDLAMATAAAPTYFKPQYVVPLNVDSHPGYWLTDGGTFMNHPVTAGKRLINSIYGTEQDEIRIFSLGTGTLGGIKGIDHLKRGGMLAWAPTIANICISGSSSSDHYDAMSENGRYYHHFSPLIGLDNAALDDTSDQNINALILSSQRTMEDPDFVRTADSIRRNYDLKMSATRGLATV
jgi:predicted acylesterase/phospholipase RssA